ncbi:MAG: hypothetical protein HY609_06880, partial [Deltaproteobacteria bacterium]|nr:hypothetical protein [Deltaproteobacteria bacterium]
MSEKHWKHPEFEQGQDERPEGVDRREFLKLMGAALAMASAAGCARRPVEKIVPYLNKPEEVTPGVANWYATTCGECPAACGMLAKVREGRPIKLEGNPDHPMNQGGLCARGQASLLNLYDPDRLRGPVRSPLRQAQGTARSVVRSPSWEAVSWEEVDQSMAAILKEVKEKSGALRLLTGHIESPATQKVIDEFLSQFPNARQIVYEPLALEELREANRLSYGEAFIPHYRFDKAKLIVSFGADFLGTWLSPVEFTKQFSQRRNLHDGMMNRLVVFESYPTVTGSNADLHIPVRPGNEIKIALGLAGEYPMEKAAAETGIDLSILRRLAADLQKHRGESL